MPVYPYPFKRIPKAERNRRKWASMKFRNPVFKYLISLKQKGCQKCGLKDPYLGLYDFHHIIPKEKKFSLTLSTKVAFKFLKDVIKEAQKCVVLCAKCHRKEHIKKK